MAKLTERNGYVYLVWTDPDTKKRRHQSLAAVGVIPKAELERIRKARDYEVSTGARLLNAHKRPSPTFRDFVIDYLRWHKGEYPDSHFRVEQIVVDHLLSQPWADKPMNLITIREIEDYKTQRRFQVRAATVEKELRTLKAVLNRAVGLKELTENPVSIVQPPRKLDSRPHHYYTKEELEKLYAVSTYGPIWRFLANTGLRRGEALHLRSDWVQVDGIRVLSTGEERTKSGEWRKIPLTDGARDALKGIKPHGDYLLPRMAPESLSRAFNRDRKRAALGGSLHSLRHTYICHLLLAGVPIRTVQLYAGHASVSTTEKYAYQVLKNDPDAAVRLAI
jgi:integrase